MESNGDMSEESGFGLDLCDGIIKRIRMRMMLRTSMIMIIKRIRKSKNKGTLKGTCVIILL